MAYPCRSSHSRRRLVRQRQDVDRLGLLLGLAQPIRSGLVEVWGIDLKGGMELAFGSAILTRFAADAERSVVLLKDAVAAMQSRARLLAGTTRQHVASVGSPSVVVLIDELAALTAYETDREMLRRANVAIAGWHGSTSTRIDALSVLSRLLDGAVRAHLVPLNQARLARRPRSESATSLRSRALTAAEVTSLLAAIDRS